MRRRLSILWLLIPVIAAGVILSRTGMLRPAPLQPPMGSVPPHFPMYGNPHINRFHGFLLNHSVYTTLDAPWGDTQALHIDDQGRITGIYIDASMQSREFLLTRGVFAVQQPSNNREEPALGPSQSQSTNGAGETVGWYIDKKHHWHGFLLRHGLFTTLDVPGSRSTEALCINNKDQIVGIYGKHSFLYQHGLYTTIDVPEAQSTQVSSINDKGECVGWFVDRGSNQHGFLLNHGVYKTLNMPGPQKAIFPQFINNKGQIVGWF